MCGRYTLSASPESVANLLGLPAIPELFPRYNIAPSQEVPALRQIGAERIFAPLRWGLIPFWAKDPKIAFSLINARSETAREKPAFRAAFQKRRCLLPADGFYEWQKVGKARQPFHFRLKTARPFALAGLWEQWQPPDGAPIATCTILTTEANDLVRPLHERMPVILPEEAFPRWLDPAFHRTEALRDWLGPYPAEALEAVAVNPRVNSPKFDDPACLEPRE